MAVTRAQLDTLFNRIFELDEEKKALSGDIKDAVDAFAEQHGGDNPKSYKKALKKAYKNFKELQKDRAEFILVESETDNITETLLSDTTALPGD